MVKIMVKKVLIINILYLDFILYIFISNIYTLCNNYTIKSNNLNCNSFVNTLVKCKKFPQNLKISANFFTINSDNIPFHFNGKRRQLHNKKCR